MAAPVTHQEVQRVNALYLIADCMEAKPNAREHLLAILREAFEVMGSEAIGRASRSRFQLSALIRALEGR
jgi:hypothetical protein